MQAHAQAIMQNNNPDMLLANLLLATLTVVLTIKALEKDGERQKEIEVTEDMQM